MKTWRLGIAVGVVASAMVVGMASCGDDDDGGGGAAAPPAVDQDPLRLEIVSATVPEFATTGARPTVRFRVIDGITGSPIDLEAEMATTTTFPNTTGPRFTLAQLDDNGDYRSYYETSRAPAAYTFDGPTPAPATRTQASAPAVTVADIEPVAGQPGTFEYTFPAPNVTDLDRTKTHTIGAWMSRRRSQADTDATGTSFNFVPSGTGAVVKDEVVNDGATSCGRCHKFVQAHGTRRNTQLCITCHSPQTGDPETNRTVDFKVMIHKIHAGDTLPSVRQGTPYFIVGNRQSIHDYSELAFPWHDHGVQHCTVCHAGGEDSENWRTKPSQATCTSCHDNVQFDGSDPTCNAQAPANRHLNCLHSGGRIAVTNANDVTTCQACHGDGAAFAIDNYHHGD